MGRGEWKSSGHQMTPETLDAILAHAARQVRIGEIQLYDVTEPTLHRDLPAMLRVSARYAPVGISSNVSFARADWPGIMAAPLSNLIIALSGGTGPVHARAHKGSDWSTVLRSLAQIEQHRQKTRVWILYHRYLDNLGAEERKAHDLARVHGFEFRPVWASTLAPDQPMRLRENPAECVLSPQQALAIGKRYPIHNSRCLVLRRNININCHGQVSHCAGFHHEQGDFLSMTIAEIQARRIADPKCVECAATGMSHYVCRNPRLDRFNAIVAGDSWRYRWDRLQHWIFYARELMMR